MPNSFEYDVFLSHSAQDKAVVRPLAERLRKDGLKVWFDEWVLKHGEKKQVARSSRRKPAQASERSGKSMSRLTSATTRGEMIQDGLEHSRMLVLCMSANAFGSDWAQLEAGTFRFRDPLNKERRFLPLRLDDAQWTINSTT